MLETASKTTIRLVARESALTSEPERHTLSPVGCVTLCLAAVSEIGSASLCGANQAMSDRAGPRGDARTIEVNCAGRAK